MKGEPARPILVTGSHRSGTTWVGRALSLSGEVEVIHEPFNPDIYNSWMPNPPQRWFQFVDPEHEGPLHADMTRVLRLRPSFLKMLDRAPTPRAYAGAVREQLRAARGRFEGRRPLLKDPLAFFAAEWLATQFGATPLVLVRHPAAFASSLKRLNWTFDFSNLDEQPKLVARYLDPFRDEVRAAAERDLDVIDQSILLWRMFAWVASDYRRAHPDWMVCRYEDLATDPIGRFTDVYERFGLTWSPAVEARLRALTAPSNGADVADGDPGGVHRHSRAAMWTWAMRLSAAEVERVRVGTADVAASWYDEQDWIVPDRIEGAARGPQPDSSGSGAT